MNPKRLKQLTKLVNSKNYWDRTKAAQANDLPLELQEILVRDEYSSVRYTLADNTSFTDRKLWELLRNDENKWVREEIAMKIEREKDRIKAEFKEKINK